ncbi:Protein of unknown function [Pyronema omphalodes CBS 100304]|uniref:Uncharacterized protein n=1 Tax=Pyronema omphalodes (strain CBS 100304) TaxID=1076935 RepID=U4KX09_PYROM|nr:Protein of unknown function [Pyronema omphalodes CBS 100304]
MISRWKAEIPGSSSARLPWHPGARPNAESTALKPRQLSYSTDGFAKCLISHIANISNQFI